MRFELILTIKGGFFVTLRFCFMASHLNFQRC